MIAATLSAQGPRRERVVDEAYAAHASLVARARQLVAEGMATDVVAGGVSTYSNTWRDERGEQVIEHRAQATVELSITALDRVGEFTAEFTELGADTRVSWRLLPDTIERLTGELRGDAVRNACAAAKDYARALGTSSLHIRALRDLASGGGPSPLGEARMAMAAAPAPELTVGEIVVSVRVEATFEASETAQASG